MIVDLTRTESRALAQLCRVVARASNAGTDEPDTFDEEIEALEAIGDMDVDWEKLAIELEEA